MIDELFHIIEDAHAILRVKGGVYRQVKVYRRRDAMYVGYGSGFLMLTRNGTSSPNVSVAALVLPVNVGHEVDKTGRVVVVSV